MKAPFLRACIVFLWILGGMLESGGQAQTPELRRDLMDLWNGSWITENLSPKGEPSVQQAGLEAALLNHRRSFASRSAVEREWQLAEIRSSLAPPAASIENRFPALHPYLRELADKLVDEYTTLHEDLFDRDTAWERLRSQVFVDFEGLTARSGELLARSIQYVLETAPRQSAAEIKNEVFSVMERRVQDYLFAFNNGTASNRRQIYAAWSQGEISLQSPDTWGLSAEASDTYDQLSPVYLQWVTYFKDDLEYAFHHPKFASRRGISPAVSEILQLLSENYFEYETYSRWFSENETLMTEALVVVDMRTRATPHEVVKLDPLTLEPTDLEEELKHTEFAETITDKRRELLLKYLAIREDVNRSIEEEIVNRKAQLSPEEEEVLWREYQKMKDLTVQATTAPKTTLSQ